MSEHCSFAGIEQGIIFQHSNCGFYRIQAALSCLYEFISRAQRFLQPGPVSGFLFGRHVLLKNSACSAMHHQYIFLLMAAIARKGHCGRLHTHAG